MKKFLTILLITSHLGLLAQDKNSGKIVKAIETFTNHELSYYQENDKRGNKVFSKNLKMGDSITDLSVTEYDSLDRKTRIYSVHSNIGFSIWDIVYNDHSISHYGYIADSIDKNSYQRDSLNKINSQKDFFELKAFKQLLNGRKKLNRNEILDSNKNIIAEIYFSDQGDTLSINTRDYNANNKLVLFRYGVKSKTPGTWDIYSIYDSNLNLTKSIRISLNNGVKDTTEISLYHYNSFNKLTSKYYYYKNTLRDKTEYFYDKNNKLIEERFYKGEETELALIRKIKYDKNGNILKQTKQHFHGNEKTENEVTTYKLYYW